MNRLLLVGVGGAVGALIRWTAESLWVTPGFPAVTLSINLLGSLAIGVLWALTQDARGRTLWWPLLGTGLLGGFTTFSTLAGEVVTADTDVGAIYLLVSLIFGPLLAAVGWSATERRLSGGNS